LENRGSKTENSGKDHSLNYLVGFAAFGLFFSTMSTALTPPEWLPEPFASDVIHSGLGVAKMEFPAGLAIPDHASYD
jgi:hypothetical protein